MKENFNILLTNGAGITIGNGEYDAKTQTYLDKTDNGWRATDKYTGTVVVFGKSTKKECQEALSELSEQLIKMRNGEKYLKGAIDFKELVESSETEDDENNDEGFTNISDGVSNDMPF